MLMLLCSLSDPGLLVFPTHRLLTGLKNDTGKQLAIRDTLLRDFEVEPLAATPSSSRIEDGRAAFGYMDSFHKQPFRVTPKDQSIADAALAVGCRIRTAGSTPPCSRRSARGALGMSEDDISHLRGLDYSKNLEDAIERVESGTADAGFFMRATPVEQVREVAEAGESMPSKSTYFYPAALTGLVFNPLA